MGALGGPWGVLEPFSVAIGVLGDRLGGSPWGGVLRDLCKAPWEPLGALVRP